MAKPASGTIRTKKTKRGVVYSAQVRYGGERPTIRLGGEWEGWTPERAQKELEWIVGAIERGEWEPPDSEPKPEPKSSGKTTYAQAAEAFLAAHAVRLPSGRDGKTYINDEWKVETTVGYIGGLAVERINEKALNRMVTDMLLDSERIAQAIERGEPEYRVVNGRRYAKKLISRATVNKFVKMAGRVLDFAYAEELRSTPSPDLRRITVEAEAPKRGYLQVRDSLDLVDAARAAEDKARGLQADDVAAIRSSSASNVRLAKDYGVSDVLIGKIKRGEIWKAPKRRNDVPRTPIVQTLLLAGPRVEHLCLLNREHVDLARRRVDLFAHKTGGSERSVPLVPTLHSALMNHLLDTDGGPRDPLFPTRDGGRQDPNNIRNKILGPLGKAIGIHVTPHMLRRTFASILAEIGVPPRRAMYLLGHKDPSFTMSVYQQVLDADESTWELLPQLLGCTPEEALITLGGRGVWVPNGFPSEKKPPVSSGETSTGGRNEA